MERKTRGEIDINLVTMAQSPNAKQKLARLGIRTKDHWFPIQRTLITALRISKTYPHSNSRLRF